MLGKEIFVQAVIVGTFLVQNSILGKEGGGSSRHNLFAGFNVSRFEALKRRFSLLFSFQFIRRNIVMVVVLSEIEAPNV